MDPGLGTELSLDRTRLAPTSKRGILRAHPRHGVERPQGLASPAAPGIPLCSPMASRTSGRVRGMSLFLRSYPPVQQYFCRYAFIDMAFAAPMRSPDLEQRQLHTYDVMCRFKINRRTRLLAGELFTKHTIPADLDQKVPVWHLGAHIASCGDTSNLRTTEMVGRTHGEGVEPIWGFMNGFAPATREMGHGHRRDMLSEAFNFNNWRKTVQEGMNPITITEPSLTSTLAQ